MIARFTVNSTWWRALLLASVAACAACGLVYELALLALSASLGRGDVVATSLIVAGYVAALGLGAIAAKPLVARAATSFLGIETALGLIGGFSATALYLAFAVTGDSLAALVVATLLIGGLVGAEVPLLLTLLQHGKRATAEDSGKVIANLNAADYLGALVGGLAWPFILLPNFGMLKATAAAGLINITAATIIALLVLRTLLSKRALIIALTGLVASALALIALLIGARGIETTARQALYAHPIIHAEHSEYQDIVVTQLGKDRRLFLDGGLQYSTRDEYRYTESLVYPAVTEHTRTALILGGGDGLAARELLRMPNIEKIVQIELDPVVIELARTALHDDNAGSLDNPRVDVITTDAFAWLRDATDADIPQGGFDAIYADLPDPDTAVLGRLYSEEFYGLIRRVAAPEARLVVQSGSPFSTPDAYWRTINTMESAGWQTTPYHVHVPTFGDWGFGVGAVEKQPTVELFEGAPELKYFNAETAEAATAFGGDVARREMEPSTLEHPVIVDDIRRGWRQAGE
ncbi:polyamine aminopropyltransferase [Corynebacterium sp. H78]|uniref:polyamine aminopropyltransferase n=1 Tax=Corynebacterium sp. H78 TaxID=3133417 RepID=UPI0030B4BAC8